MRLFHSINGGSQNCEFFRKNWPKDASGNTGKANDSLPDDMQPCWVRCLLCIYPFEDEIDKREIEKFRDNVCSPRARETQPMLKDATSGLFCDLVMGYGKRTKANIDRNVLALDSGELDSDGALIDGGPMYPGLPRHPRDATNGKAGRIQKSKLGLIGALHVRDDVECTCFSSKDVVTKTEFFKLFMHATLVIQCNMFHALEQSFLRTQDMNEADNARYAGSSGDDMSD